VRGRLLAELCDLVDDPREAEPLRFEPVLRDEAVLRERLDAVLDLDSPLRALLLADFDELEPDLLDVPRLRLFPRALDFDSTWRSLIANCSCFDYSGLNWMAF